MSEKVKFEEEKVIIKTGKSDFSIPEKFYKKLWKIKKEKKDVKKSS